MEQQAQTPPAADNKPAEQKPEEKPSDLPQFRKSCWRDKVVPSPVKPKRKKPSSCVTSPAKPENVKEPIVAAVDEDSFVASKKSATPSKSQEPKIPPKLDVRALKTNFWGRLLRDSGKGDGEKIEDADSVPGSVILTTGPAKEDEKCDTARMVEGRLRDFFAGVERDAAIVEVTKCVNLYETTLLECKIIDSGGLPLDPIVWFRKSTC